MGGRCSTVSTVHIFRVLVFRDVCTTMASTANDAVRHAPERRTTATASVGSQSNDERGTPVTSAAHERLGNDAYPSSSMSASANVSASLDPPRSRTTPPTTPSTSPHSPPQSNPAICEVQDLYYAIELRARGNPAGREKGGNGWRPRAPKICRHLWSVRGEGNSVNAADPGDVISVDSSAGRGSTAVDKRSRKLVLLKGISCRVHAGDMVAVIVSDF